MPQVKWDNIFEKNSFEPLLRKPGKLCKRVDDVYKKIADELIDEFGISENYRKIFNKENEIELLYIEILQTGDRSRLALIQMLKYDIEKLKDKHKKADTFKTVLYFEGEGIKRDYETITIYEYNKIAGILQERAKKQYDAIKQAQLKRNGK